MKTSVVALTLLLLSAATTALAQNQIYINQITTGGNTTLVQVGSLNKIGTSAAAQSDITGDNIVFEMRQIGNSNDTKFSIASANNLKLLTVATGNSNTQQYYFSGASNNANILLNGNSNKFLLNGDTSGITHRIVIPLRLPSPIRTLSSTFKVIPTTFALELVQVNTTTWTTRSLVTPIISSPLKSETQVALLQKLATNRPLCLPDPVMTS